jgi:hypothetical protein
MNTDLLELDLPFGEFPDLSPRQSSPEENDAWHLENRKMRLLRGDTDSEFSPVNAFFSMEESASRSVESREHA